MLGSFIGTSESTHCSAHRSDKALRQSQIEAKSNATKVAQVTRVPLARVSNTSKTEPILVTRSATGRGYISELLVINQDQKGLAESFAAMELTSSDPRSQSEPLTVSRPPYSRILTGFSTVSKLYLPFHL